MADGIWQIEQNCPQCGAPVTLAETDRLLNCPFCRTRLYLVAEGQFHYHIVPPAVDGALLFIPYWRFRGSAFCVRSGEISHRFVDASTLAIGLPGIPASLGLRPQVLKLHFVTPATAGKFLAPDLPAPPTLNAGGPPEPGVFYREYIGEALSVIHAPLCLKDGILKDAVLDRPLRHCTSAEAEQILERPDGARGQVLFVPTLCPHCGWDMEGQKDSLVLICRNCHSAWACPRKTFERVPFAVLTPPDRAGDVLAYLPFWRMRPRFSGLDLASQADLVRLANLPKRITAAMETSPLHFWSPAFKVNPALYARWAHQMTVFQPPGDAVDLLPTTPLYPVTLPLSEAAAGIMITLARLVTGKRGIYPRLQSVQVTLDEAFLEYHPFVGSGRELLHPGLQVALNPTALAYGIRL